MATGMLMPVPAARAVEAPAGHRAPQAALEGAVRDGPPGRLVLEIEDDFAVTPTGLRRLTSPAPADSPAS